MIQYYQIPHSLFPIQIVRPLIPSELVPDTGHRSERDAYPSVLFGLPSKYYQPSP